MAQTNRKVQGTGPRTHEGGAARSFDALAALQRTLTTAMLWEGTFYEDGESIADRIRKVVLGLPQHDLPPACYVIREAKNSGIRHAPLLAARYMMKRTDLSALSRRELVTDVIRRADELAEFMALWGDEPLSKAAQRGIADAFHKFDEYQLAKYDRKGREWSLRDVMFVTHPRPRDAKEADLFKRLADGELATPDTWETNLSGGADKRETFERLLRERKLGGLALLRNLRGMTDAGVDTFAIRQAIQTSEFPRVLPFRFVAAHKHAPAFGRELEAAFLRRVVDYGSVPLSAVILVDTSGSMTMNLSERSDMNRIDAAAALAAFAREVFDEAHVAQFPNDGFMRNGFGYQRRMPRSGGITSDISSAYRGFALIDKLREFGGGGTPLIESINEVVRRHKPDVAIVITDEQARDSGPLPNVDHGFIINVAPYENGVQNGRWTRIDGWSEKVVDYMMATIEREQRVSALPAH